MKKKLFSCLVILLFLVGLGLCCRYRPVIRQKVSRDSIIENTYYVNTTLWSYIGIFPSSIEKIFFDYNVKKENIKSVKEEQYKKILPFYNKMKGAIEDGS